MPDQAADDTIESLHSKIFDALGGHAIDVQPAQTSFQLLEADQPAELFSVNMRFDIAHRLLIYLSSQQRYMPNHPLHLPCWMNTMVTAELP